MARGNHVNGVTVSKRFGLYIVTPASSYESFGYYDKITLSKANRIIGHWRPYGGHHKCRDYLQCLPGPAELIRKTDRVLIFKSI